MTTDSANLLAHLEAENAKTLAWVAEAPAQRWATTWMTDLEAWAEMGVHSVEDFIKYQHVSYVYETTREVYGYKPSWSGLMGLTLDEVKAEADRISKEAEEYALIAEGAAKYDEAEREQKAWTEAELHDKFIEAAEAAGY